MTLEKLPTKLNGTGDVRGFKFTKINETDNAYLYEVNTNVSIHYEVFEKKITRRCIDFDKRLFSDTEFKEIYPKTNDFGIWTYTFKKLNNAIEKLKSI